MNLKLVEAQCVQQKRKLNISHLIVAIIIFFLIISFFVLIKNKKNNSSLETAVLSTNEDLTEENIDEEHGNEKNNETEFSNIEQVMNRLPNLTDNSKDKIKKIYRSEEKIAYLTFDDGPSSTVTPLILDLLKENGIYATFFTLGKNIEYYPEIVKREYDEGHYIANHGYSHVYKNIYASVQNVLDEFNQTENAIQNAIQNPDYHSHLIRFPGGSRGNKYQNLISEAITALEQNNVAYVDWNCLTGDSAGNKDKESLMNELINTSTNKNSLVILMHDASDKILTYETLQDVINYLKEQGYVFKNFYDIME